MNKYEVEDEILTQQFSEKDEDDFENMFQSERKEEAEVDHVRKKQRCILDKYSNFKEPEKFLEKKISNLKEEKWEDENEEVASLKESENSFDMFNDEITNTLKRNKNDEEDNFMKSAGATDADYDDAEGYYRATIGEVIQLSSIKKHYKAMGIIGKGVFSTVLKCLSIDKEKDVIAMKLIRNNETMAKAAQNEFKILKLLQPHNSQENNHIVILCQNEPLDYRNHTLFLFEYLPHNLRQILRKFGSNVGLNLSAVRSYAKQLLRALQHLNRFKVIHADLKPDNILVSEDYSTLKICDFGSAFFSTDQSSFETTPYLISRFYRPPEVILGLDYDMKVDLWSVAVTLSELYTGHVLFPGSNNNDMIKKFMDLLGPFSHKLIKRHCITYQEKLNLTSYFDKETCEFRQSDIDIVTKQPILRIIPKITKPQKTILEFFFEENNLVGKERLYLTKFVDFLNQCLVLDPMKRISVNEALKQDFFSMKI